MAIDYQAAALAAMEALPADGTPPPEPEAKGKEVIADEKPAVEVKSDAKPDEKKPDEAPKSRFEKSFEDLVREKAEIRKQKDALKADSTKLSRAQALEAAIATGDAAAVLAAAGLAMPAPGAKAAAVDPVAQLQAEVAELRAERAAAAKQSNRAAVLTQAKEMAAKNKEKYNHVVGLGEEEQALSYIEEYFAAHRELPVPGDLPESIELAMEAVEIKLKKEAERWSKVLTGFKKPDSVPDSKPVVSSPTSNSGGKTLTNTTGSGPRAASGQPQTVRKTEDDYRRDALKAFEADL